MQVDKQTERTAYGDLLQPLHDVARPHVIDLLKPYGGIPRAVVDQAIHDVAKAIADAVEAAREQRSGDA